MSFSDSLFDVNAFMKDPDKVVSLMNRLNVEFERLDRFAPKSTITDSSGKISDLDNSHDMMKHLQDTMQSVMEMVRPFLTARGMGIMLALLGTLTVFSIQYRRIRTKKRAAKAQEGAATAQKGRSKLLLLVDPIRDQLRRLGAEANDTKKQSMGLLSSMMLSMVTKLFQTTVTVCNSSNVDELKIKSMFTMLAIPSVRSFLLVRYADINQRLSTLNPCELYFRTQMLLEMPVILKRILQNEKAQQPQRMEKNIEVPSDKSRSRGDFWTVGVEPPKPSAVALGSVPAAVTSTTSAPGPRPPVPPPQPRSQPSGGQGGGEVDANMAAIKAGGFQLKKTNRPSAKRREEAAKRGQTTTGSSSRRAPQAPPAPPAPGVSVPPPPRAPPAPMTPPPSEESTAALYSVVSASIGTWVEDLFKMANTQFTSNRKLYDRLWKTIVNTPNASQSQFVSKLTNLYLTVYDDETQSTLAKALHDFWYTMLPDLNFEDPQVMDHVLFWLFEFKDVPTWKAFQTYLHKTPMDDSLYKTLMHVLDYSIKYTPTHVNVFLLENIYKHFSAFLMFLKEHEVKFYVGKVPSRIRDILEQWVKIVFTYKVSEEMVEGSIGSDVQKDIDAIKYNDLIPAIVKLADNKMLRLMLRVNLANYSKNTFPLYVLSSGKWTKELEDFTSLYQRRHVSKVSRGQVETQELGGQDAVSKVIDDTLNKIVSAKLAAISSQLEQFGGHRQKLRSQETEDFRASEKSQLQDQLKEHYPEINSQYQKLNGEVLAERQRLADEVTRKHLKEEHRLEGLRQEIEGLDAQKKSEWADALKHAEEMYTEADKETSKAEADRLTKLQIQKELRALEEAEVAEVQRLVQADQQRQTEERRAFEQLNARFEDKVAALRAELATAEKDLELAEQKIETNDNEGLTQGYKMAVIRTRQKLLSDKNADLEASEGATLLTDTHVARARIETKIKAYQAGKFTADILDKVNKGFTPHQMGNNKPVPKELQGNPAFVPAYQYELSMDHDGSGTLYNTLHGQVVDLKAKLKAQTDPHERQRHEITAGLNQKFTARITEERKLEFDAKKSEVESKRQVYKAEHLQKLMADLDSQRSDKLKDHRETLDRTLSAKQKELEIGISANSTVLAKIHAIQQSKQNAMVEQFLKSIEQQILKWLNVELEGDVPKVRFLADYNLTMDVVLPNLVQGVRKDWIKPDEKTQVRDVFRLAKKKTGSPWVDNMALSVGIKL